MKTNNQNLLIFVLIVLILVCLNIVTKSFLNINELIYNFYSEKLAQEQLNNLIENQQKWQWIGYAIIPVLILIRSSLVALVLSVGNFFYNMDEDESPKFSRFFRIALYGEFVFLFVGVFKLLYFLFIKTDYTFLDLQQYYPLSLINYLDLETLEPWLVYPMQSINLFELVYFFVLVYGFWKLKQNKFWQSLEIVGVSYIIALTIWYGLVMFLTLNIS